MKLRFRCPQNHEFIITYEGALPPRPLEGEQISCPECGWQMAASEGEPESDGKPEVDRELE